MTEQDNSALMISMAQTMAMQAAITSIPIFDGKNIPLKDFIQDIRNADADIPGNQKESFIKKVLSKLRGSARNSTYGVAFTSIDDLVKHLKQRFAPGKNFSYYNAQLNDLRMVQGDSVGDFRDKLNILLMGAENALKEEKGQSFKSDMMVPMKEAAIDIFIRGLPAHISSGVDACHPTDLDMAYKEAVRIESRIRSRILPDNRTQMASHHRYNEDQELSQNLRGRNFTPYHSNFPGGQQFPQPQQQHGVNPAYIGCVEGASVEVEPEYVETAEPPFVGYFVTNLNDPSGGPSYYPIHQERGSFQNRGGYAPRRGGRGRGGYTPNTPRIENNQDPRLYYPNAPGGGTPPMNHNSQLQRNPNAIMSPPLNSQGARPQLTMASPNSNNMATPMSRPDNNSNQTQRGVQSGPQNPTSTPRVMLTRTPQRTSYGLVPVAQLEETIRGETTPQW